MSTHSEDLPQFENRKRAHLQWALHPDAQAREASDFDRVRLPHDALPEIDLADVRLDAPFRAGARMFPLATPFFVSGMTAGHAGAPELNRRLAQACARRGWIFGVGSQRRELRADFSAVDGWSELKEANAGLVLLGNLGIAQAIEVGVAGVARLAENIGADAFAIHLNALQEAIQPEGTPRFRGAVDLLRAAAGTLPIVVKETGCGISPATARKLAGIPLAALDVAGLGGTHWGRIEGFRAEAADARAPEAAASRTFANWGVGTAESVRNARAALGGATETWASGGVRSGLDAARALALGATRAGFAKPALEAALAGDEALDAWMERMEFELRTALFCTGCATPAELRERALGEAMGAGRD